MTLSEFRSWLDGFSEAINGAPNEDQWAKIKAKLATVDVVVSAPRLTPQNPDIWRGPFRTDPTRVYTAYGVGDQSDNWRLRDPA